MQVNDTRKILYPLILDGGLSNVLEDLGYDLNHKLWTAHLLDKNPEAILQVHLQYLRAGAQCITTASYQASIRGLSEVGYSREEAEDFILKSVKIAEMAVERAQDEGLIHERPLIAASIGPYGAYMADGSEYSGNYNITDEALRSFHKERIEILDRSNADILACETIPSMQEAKILGDITKDCKKPVWISFSCKDEQHINDGTEIMNCVSLFEMSVVLHQ